MPAPKFNQYYKNRINNGRKRIFNDTTEIIDKLDEYLEDCRNNPIEYQEMIKGGNRSGEIVLMSKPQIPTLKGFCIYLGITYQTFSNYRKDENYKDFFETFTYVSDILENEMLKNSVTGQANPMLAARLLGLKEKQDIASNDKEISIPIMLTAANMRDEETIKKLNEYLNK